MRALRQDKRESDGYLEVAKGPCGHGWEIDLTQQHRPAAAQRLKGSAMCNAMLKGVK